MRFVLKFGGTSVGSGERMEAAAARVQALAAQGHQVVTVVSAQGDTTDDLLLRAGQILPLPPAREMDALLATGEQQSAALLAMYLAKLGTAAVSLTGAQAGIHTDSCFGNAQITWLDPTNVLRELNRGNAVTVAGFQGVDPTGAITTLGRGGSDTTAVALAAALKADRCIIYTDVDGVYDRDPRKFPDAHRFKSIGWQEMLQLARSGAQVLHDRCVELAQREGVTFEVRSAFRDGEGTLVGGETQMNRI